MTVLSVVIVIMAAYAWETSDRTSEAAQNARKAQVAQQAVESKEATIDGLNLKGDGGASLDDAIDRAIEQEDIGQVRSLRARRKAVTQFLESGAQLLQDVLPQISDSQALQDIGSAMSDQFLFGGLVEAQKVLTKQSPSVDSAEQSSLDQVNSWLGELSVELEDFDLGEFGIVTPGAEGLTELATATSRDVPAGLLSAVGESQLSYEQFLEGLQPAVLQENPWVLWPLFQLRLEEGGARDAASP